MSSVRDNRQRAAARARLEREMAARQEAARRRRLLQARIGAGVAAVVVIGLVAWIVVATTGGKESSTTANGCYWAPEYPSTDPSALPSGVVDAGTPSTTPPTSGFQELTFDTNLGTVKVEMDLSKTPCTAASMAHLANSGFYNNSSCHRLVQSIFALQCGDPSGTGQGGVTYQFADENLPAGYPAYYAGDVAMANTGQPGSNGSQFFFLWDTSALQGDYTLWGHVTEGLDIIKQVGAGGDDGAYEAEAGGGHPNTAFTFNSVTASEIYPVSVLPSPSASASAEETPSPAAS